MGRETEGTLELPENLREAMDIKLPENLRKAMDGGVLSTEQLRQLIGIEAQAIRLDFDSAISRARSNTLPPSAIGTDLRLLIQMLLGEA